jgi:glycosyltransferase involved in cell wall biosynthesis
VSSEVRRLCIVTPHHLSVTGGGAEYQIECLIEALAAEQRYEIFYLARSAEPSCRPAGYRVVRIGTRIQASRFGYAMDAVPLYRALRSLRPQVIYQRVACGYTGICAWYARRSGARLIWHVAHDTDVMLERLDPGRNPVRGFLETTCIEYAIRHANHIITQTEHQARLLRHNYGREADGVIRNFQPNPTEEIDKSGPLTVLWVANFKRWKQPELFVALADALRDLDSVRFVMAGASAGGSGTADWNAAVMAQIRQARNLDYLGPLPQTEINRLFAHAHVFVNTSKWEGFPNTFIQAWMREVPVVSLSVDPDQLLAHGNMGIVAENPGALASAVRALIMDPARRAEYGERARRYAMREHSLENIKTLQRLIDTGSLQACGAPPCDRPRLETSRS